jgi:transcriptional regulator with XRE-family HTH domain
MDRELNPLFGFFATELKRARNAAGLTQDSLGKRIGFSGEQVSKVELGDRRPTGQFAEGCDAVFPELGGTFGRLVAKAEKSHGVYPSWFESWVDAEERASVLRSWEPLMVPGLLQTPDYARAVFEAWQAVDGRDTETDVSGRLARQAIFDRPSPPLFMAVLDEAVLYRRVGDVKVMHTQLGHLLALADRPRVTLQVVPAEVGVHVGLLGGFAIAGFGDETPGMVYLETPDEGQITKHPTTVDKVSVTFDVLRAGALSTTATRDLIAKVAEERWKA